MTKHNAKKNTLLKTLRDNVAKATKKNAGNRLKKLVSGVVPWFYQQGPDPEGTAPTEGQEGVTIAPSIHTRGEWEGMIEPLKHQKECVQWMINICLDSQDKQVGGLVELDAGLGKTYTTLCHIMSDRNYNVGLSKSFKGNPVSKMYLVMVPAGVRDQWKAEIAKMTNIPDEKVHVIRSSFADPPDLTGDGIVIITKDIVHAMYKGEQQHNWVDRITWASIYIDEIQDIRNGKSLKLSSIMHTKSRQKFGLSATTIMNDPNDLKAIFRWLDVEPFNQSSTLDAMFRAPDKHKELRDALEKLKFARTVDQLKEELGVMVCDFSSYNISIPMEEMDGMEVFIYNMTCMATRMKINEMNRIGTKTNKLNCFPLITMQRKCALHPLLTMYNEDGFNYRKMYDQFATFGISIRGNGHSSKSKVTCSVIKKLFAENPKRKVLVFSTWTTPMALLRNLLAREGFRAATFDGKVSMANRTKLLEDTRNDKIDVLLINFEVGGRALNMEFSDTVILHDPPYNEATATQAGHRVRRLGQKKSVTQISMVTQNTMEEWVMNVVDTKEAKKDEWLNRKGNKGSGEKQEKQDRMFAYYSRRDRNVCPPNEHFVSSLQPLAALPNTAFDEDEDNLPDVFYDKTCAQETYVMSGRDYIQSLVAQSQPDKWTHDTTGANPNAQRSSTIGTSVVEDISSSDGESLGRGNVRKGWVLEGDTWVSSDA